MDGHYDRHSFLSLTGSTSVKINGSEGWNQVSIKVKSTSTTDLTISGSTTDKIFGRDPGSITLTAGEQITIGGDDDAGVNNVTLTIPSGCVVDIVGVKYNKP